MFVHNVVFDMNVFTDHVISQNDTVSYNSTFLDGTATSDNGVFYSTFDAAAVGNDGSLDACGFIIMCGARVVCTGVDSLTREETAL